MQYTMNFNVRSFVNKFLEDLKLVHACKSSKPRGLHVTANSHSRDVAKINVDGGCPDAEEDVLLLLHADIGAGISRSSVMAFEGLVDPASLEAQACSEALSPTLHLYLGSIFVASD